jgi:excisionase family DNA binding protein
MNINDSLLSKSEVMKRLGIGEKALRRLIREGRLRVVKFGKTSPLKFRQLDLARCLEGATSGGTVSVLQSSPAL